MRVLLLTAEGVSANLVEWVKRVEDQVIVCTEKLEAKEVEQLNAQYLISYNYRYIIRQDVLNQFKESAINLHISYLPWNKGSDPNFWSIVEDSPKGVTIHKLDAGVDTGDILLQTEVQFDMDSDTLDSSYAKLHEEIQNLFKKNWESLRKGGIEAFSQSDSGSKHFHKEFEAIEHILGDEGWEVPISVLKDRYKALQGERI